MYTVIGTWRMSYQGVDHAREVLAKTGCAGDAVEQAVMMVEDEPSFSSVGFGGLPDSTGHVMLDASYMDGCSLRFGAIMSAENISNPIRAARLLCGKQTNCVLAGRGAEQFAIESGLPMKDMRTENALRQWREALQIENRQINSYKEHDTVCVLALDKYGAMVAGTSTSGLFLKKPGRVGDSPIIGSGFYCDARYGAAAATGLGEDIMRGCLSYEIVSLMRNGCTPQSACEKAVKMLSDRKMEMGEEAGEISVIALSPQGETGAATTLAVFPFVVGNETGTILIAARPRSNGCMDICKSNMEELAYEP